MSQAHLNRQNAGNGVTTSYSYDPADGRLSELKAVKGDDVHQHFSYLYDPVGNVRSITDHTHVTRYHANQRIDGIRTFAYDSLYRLESATGLEASGAGTQPELPGLIPPADLSLRQLAQGEHLPAMISISMNRAINCPCRPPPTAGHAQLGAGTGLRRGAGEAKAVEG